MEWHPVFPHFHPPGSDGLPPLPSGRAGFPKIIWPDDFYQLKKKEHKPLLKYILFTTTLLFAATGHITAEGMFMIARQKSMLKSVAPAHSSLNGKPLGGLAAKSNLKTRY